MQMQLSMTAGKNVRKMHASTRIPIEHKLKDGDGRGGFGNRHRDVKVVSLDTNC